MYKLKIFSIGKTKETWLVQAIDEYTRRLKPILSIEWSLAKGEKQLIEAMNQESSFVVLDPNGKAFDSELFSSWLIETFHKEHSRLSLVIGGAEGIPQEIALRAKDRISLSKLTFTHQLTRLILLEQIYRAFEIEKGSQYHK